MNLSMASSVRVVTDPVVEPIDAAYVRAHMHLDDGADDAMLELMITAARGVLEEHIDSALITTEYEAAFDGPVDAGMVLPFARPVIGVSDVHSYDADGVGTLVGASGYWIDTDGVGVVRRVGAAAWGSGFALREAGSLKVTYTAGFGATANDVPEELRRALAEIVRAQYDQDTEGGMIPPLAQMLIRRWCPLEVA